LNYLDIFIVLLIIWGGWKGFKKGFVIELFTLFALFLGLYAGIHFSDFVAEKLLPEENAHESYVPIVSFTITFLAVGAMVYFGGKAFEKVVKIAQLSFLNKALGAIFGIAKMMFFMGAGILILESMDLKSDFIDEETKDGSLLYNPSKKIVTGTIPAFNESTLFLENALTIEEDIVAEDA
jgi:membrane protein required for colicin V production